MSTEDTGKRLERMDALLEEVALLLRRLEAKLDAHLEKIGAEK